MEVKSVLHTPNVVQSMSRSLEPRFDSKNTLQNMQENIEERIKARVEAVNEFLVPLNTSIKFVFHEELQEYYVEVIDQITGEVIREIPPKKFLDMYAMMAEFMGLFVDRKG